MTVENIGLTSRSLNLYLSDSISENVDSHRDSEGYSILIMINSRFAFIIKWELIIDF